MDLANETPWNADLLRTAFGENHLLAGLIARPTFRIEGRALVPTPDEPWPIDAGPMDTPVGELPGDMPFLTGGVDVFVVGRAYQPGGAEGPSLRVDLRVGDSLAHGIQVFGDRFWQRGRGGLEATEPKPFVSMSLGYENAYGGKASIPEGEMTCLANPLGKGFYVSEEQAEGGALPNLESPDDLIASWDQQPDPVGLAPYPETGSLRALNAVDFDPEKLDAPQVERLKPLFFNRAHPKLVIPPDRAPRPGDEVHVTNVRPEGDLRFALPDLELHAHVQLEDRSYLFPLHLDQLGVLAEEQRVFLSYRSVFRYRVVPRERRRTTLHAGPLPAAVPPEYVQTWEEE